MIEILSDTDRPGKYWSDLKAKLKKEGSELSEEIGRLKMATEDGKMRLTDVGDTEHTLPNSSQPFLHHSFPYRKATFYIAIIMHHPAEIIMVFA